MLRLPHHPTSSLKCLTSLQLQQHPIHHMRTSRHPSRSSIKFRCKELLSKEELGNEKPTCLLRRMKKLVSDKYNAFDTDLFKQLFYQRLPTSIHQGLFTVKSKKLSVEDLAAQADDYMATLPPPVSSVTAHPLPKTTSAPAVTAVTPQASDLQQLTALVSKLMADVS